MSRLAKKPIKIPAGVTVTRSDDAIVIKGVKGEKKVRLIDFCGVDMNGDSIRVAATAANIQARANVGTLWSLLNNAIEGVTKGFAKALEIEGVGYRAVVEGDTLVLSLGYVNPVRFKIPEGLTVTVQKNVIAISGIDKELVGRIASQIRKLKKPEPYKGKGIRYQGEIVRRKAGKKAVVTAT